MDNNANVVSKGTAKKYSGIALAALLLFSTVATVMAFSPKSALAQTAPVITTSTDKFFGGSFVQVIISDNAKNSQSGTQESVAATVRVKDETGAIKDSKTINAFETGLNSGQFEFFVTTTPGDSGTPNPSAARSVITGATVDVATKVSIARFGNNPAGDGQAVNPDVILNTGATAPKDGWKVEIEYVGAGAVKTVNFAPSAAQFSIDRATAGTGSNTIFTISDQDANNDPTGIDSIVVDPSTGTTVPLGTANLLTGTFQAAQTFTFTETGTNTGVFERTFTSTNLAIPSPLSSPSTANYVLKDYDVYTATTGTGSTFAITPTSSTVTKSLVFQNQDGALTPLSQMTFASEVPVTVTDSDANTNTRSADTITASTTTGVTVSVDASGGDSELVNVKETGDNTGIFAADLNNGKLPVTFLNSGNPTPNNGVLELRVSDITGNDDIVVTYRDAAKADGTSDTASTQTSTTRLPISHSPGQLSFDSAQATSTGKINAVLTDNDLNNNPDAIESYTVALSGATSPYPFTGFSNIANIAVKIKGVPTSTAAPATAQTIVFIETGANTGVFKAEVDVQKLSTGFSDGDQVEFKYQDSMETPTADSTATFTIGKPSSAVSVDSTTVPVPLKTNEPSAVLGLSSVSPFTAAPAQADSVKFRLTITDATKNTNSGVQETITESQATSGGNNIALTTSSGAGLVLERTGVNTGVGDIKISGFPLTETGPNTGVFSGMITLTRSGGTATLQNLDNAKLVFTYDSNIATVTLRPNNLVITADKSVVKNGDNVTITITDLDRNLDTENKDTVPFVVETKSDSIPGSNGVFVSTADETGVNTGTFTKTMKVGVDIKLASIGTSISQATELKISATDRDSAEDNSADRDLTLKVGTTTGSISVTPDLIGPGTKLSIFTTDNDLNVNPAGVDLVPSSGVSTDFVTVTTDRSGFPSTKVAGEETGSNTGVFKTTIKMKPYTPGTTITPPSGTKDLTGFLVLPGDLVSVKYIDTKDASGNKVTISKVVKVVSVDPVMNTTKSSYGAGESLSLTVADLDANTDGEAVDSLKVRVTSDSDPVGFDVSGLETGVNTGVFTFSVPSTTSVSSGSITVKTGDNVYFKYTDNYPADYADRVKQVADPSKDFTLVVPIGVSSTTGGNVNATTASSPVLKDFSNNNVSEVTVGKQVILSTTVANNQGTAQPFAAIVEVRDADGITQYLQWQTGTLNANGSTNVGLSWTPSAAGTYSVRTFVVSDIAHPSALSLIASTNITVS